MEVTAKQLRMHPSRVLQKVQQLGSVTVTLRGKPVARIIPFAEKSTRKDLAEYSAVGMWADRKDMKNPSAWVRKIRKPRYSLH